MRLPRAGRFKDALQIQEPTTTKDEYGGVIHSWTAVAERRCDIEIKSGSEGFRGEGEEVQYVYVIRFRYEQGLIRPSYRLVDVDTSPNRIFDILTIIDRGNWQQEIILDCVERAFPKRV